MSFENKNRDRNDNGNGRGNFNREPQRWTMGSGTGNIGRIENFEKPLIQLLKEINRKLDILIEKKD